MELGELNEAERVALVAIARRAVIADRGATDGEVQGLQRIVAAFGEPAYQQAVRHAERLESEEDLRMFLQTIVRPEARDLIYGTALELALADNLDPAEATLFQWLQSLWQVEIAVQT